MSLDKLRRLARARRLKDAAEPEPQDASAVEPAVEPTMTTAEPTMTTSPLTLFLEPPSPSKPKRAKKPRAPAATVVLENKMIAAIKATFGDGVVTKKWSVKERALAKRLLESYSLEMTEQVIEQFVAEWPNMMRQSRGRLYGLPTINFLWATQDRFFGAAQLGQNPSANPANIDEYQGVEDEDDDW